MVIKFTIEEVKSFVTYQKAAQPQFSSPKRGQANSASPREMQNQQLDRLDSERPAGKQVRSNEEEMKAPLQ